MNKEGATFIPIRLLMSIVVIAVISMLLYTGIKNWMIISAENNVQEQIGELVAMFQEMISGSARDVLYENFKIQSGEVRTFTFNLPSSLIYLGIGTDPDPDNDGKLERGIMEDGKVIVYRIGKGSKKFYWLNIKIRLGKYEEGNWIIKKPAEGLILTKGKYKISFELVEYHYEKYILIHANNSESIPYLDTNPPIINIKEPKNGEYPYGDICLKWFVYDEKGIESIKIVYKNETTDWILLEERQEWESWEYTIEKEKMIGNEKYWIRVIAKDKGGNTAYDEIEIFLKI